MAKISKWQILSSALNPPITEERKAEVLMNIHRKLKAAKKTAQLQKISVEEITEMDKLIESLDEEILLLVPKIPEYKF